MQSTLPVRLYPARYAVATLQCFVKDETGVKPRTCRSASPSRFTLKASEITVEGPRIGCKDAAQWVREGSPNHLRSAAAELSPPAPYGASDATGAWAIPLSTWIN
jgi:hypothetical protein